MRLRKNAEPNWEAIASFYAGRPITIQWGLQGKQGTRDFNAGKIFLSADIRKSLDDFVKYGPKDPRSAVLGFRGLAGLIHESIHDRHFNDPTTDIFQQNVRNPNTGFYSASNEPQAMALGSELIPDMLQRFFGIKIGSKVGKRYEKAIQSFYEHQAAYSPGFENPPTGFAL